MSLQCIARETKTHGDSLLRILRLLAHEGVLEEVEVSQMSSSEVVHEGSTDDSKPFFRLTPTGQLLCTNETNTSATATIAQKGPINQDNQSLQCMVDYYLDKPMWNAWPCLTNSIALTDGRDISEKCSPFQAANEQTTSIYYSRAENFKSLQAANAFVKYIADWETETCVDAIDWSQLCYRVWRREIPARRSVNGW